MDDIVKAALIKWPDVPHCYGWLALDARGQWRMRDARCQALGLAGEVIRHPALIGFINRNYLHDANGCWYFQNGPQRVYVELESAPYIARTTPAGLMLHTGLAFDQPEVAFLNPSGELFFAKGEVLAQLDDRDLAELLPNFYVGNTPVSDERFIAYLSQSSIQDPLVLRLTPTAAKAITVQIADTASLMSRYGYCQQPAQDQPPHSV